jgi:sigma-E factor negative regulatory protein RseA
VANPTIIRDARLDRYLSAHQQFAGSSALGQSSRYLRSATVEAPAR